LFFPPSTRASNTSELHDHVTEAGRRYAFCVTLQHREGLPAGEGSPACVPCAAAGAPLQGPSALQLQQGAGGGALVERMVATRLRSNAEMRKAVVRVEAVYELDAEGRSC
jgi:hypothetical protein